MTFLCDNVLNFFRFPFKSGLLVQTTRNEGKSPKITTAMPVKRVLNAQHIPRVEYVQLRAQCQCIIYLPFNLAHFFFLGDINGIANSLRLFTSSFQSFHFLKTKVDDEEEKGIMNKINKTNRCASEYY